MSFSFWPLFEIQPPLERNIAMHNIWHCLNVDVSVNMQIANQYIFKRLLRSQIINQPYVMLIICMLTVPKPRSPGIVYVHTRLCVSFSMPDIVLLQKEDQKKEIENGLCNPLHCSYGCSDFSFCLFSSLFYIVCKREGCLHSAGGGGKHKAFHQEAYAGKV